MKSYHFKVIFEVRVQGLGITVSKRLDVTKRIVMNKISSVIVIIAKVVEIVVVKMKLFHYPKIKTNIYHSKQKQSLKYMNKRVKSELSMHS